MISIHSHPLSSPLNQLVGLMILGGALLYAYSIYDLYQHGALGSIWRRGLIRSYQILAFLGGLVTLATALLSPLDTRAEISFSAHMIQHILLTMLAPPLLLFGIPSPIARAALFRPWLRSLLGRLTDPFVAFTIFYLNLYVWHVPDVYDFALQNEFAHALQHTLFFYTAMLFWWRIIDPTHGWFPLWDWPPAKWVYLLVAAPASYILGAFLWGSGRIIYPHYAGIEALADQRLGGLIMWIQGWMFLMVSMLVFFRGYHPEREPA